ncbi:MAG: hypothetical protein ACFB14_08815 [Leptolyngbyaceae cyanobacterium]
MTHQHPPTECTDEKALTKVVTPGDIKKSVSWYELHWTEIADALPMNVEGTIYTARWQEIFDYKTLPAWREGKLKGLSVPYIYLALRRLFKGLRERAGSQ